MLETYITSFENLKFRGRPSNKVSNKVILLLAIISLYEEEENEENEIKLGPKLQQAFESILNEYKLQDQNSLESLCEAYWKMAEEGFWHIVPLWKEENTFEKLVKSSKNPSYEQITGCVKYAELDEDLHFLMTLSTGRLAFKKCLLEKYLDIKEVPSDQEKDKKVNEDFILPENNFTKEQTPYLNIEKESTYNQLSLDAKILLNLSFFTFLNEHRFERESFLSLFPTAVSLFNKINNQEISSGIVPHYIQFAFIDFLNNLKVSLMPYNDTVSFIDSLTEAINRLNDSSSIQEDGLIETAVETESSNKEINQYTNTNVTSRKKDFIRKPLEPAGENRHGSPWTEEEERTISRYYFQGYSLEEIGQAQGRSERSIRMRLEALSIIEPTNTEDDVSEQNTTVTEEEQIMDPEMDFIISNGPDNSKIYSLQGELLYSTKGVLTVLDNAIYRFCFSFSQFTANIVERNENHFSIGKKIIKANANSTLLKTLDSEEYLKQITKIDYDSTIGEYKICSDNVWYDSTGYVFNSLSSSQMPTNALKAFEIHEQKNKKHEEEFVPKGKFKRIKEFANSSYDILLVMAIIDLYNQNTKKFDLSYDDLGYTMIGIAWEILDAHPELKEKAKNMNKCIESIIKLTGNTQEEALSWHTSRDLVYQRIKKLPKVGFFAQTLESLLYCSIYNIDRTWLQTDDDIEIVQRSRTFDSACLYAIYPRENDSYILLNDKWKFVLIKDGDNLRKYFSDIYIDFLNMK